MFGALKRGFRSMASLILVRNVAGELRPKRTLAASRGFLAAARLSCLVISLRSDSDCNTEATYLPTYFIMMHICSSGAAVYNNLINT